MAFPFPGPGANVIAVQELLTEADMQSFRTPLGEVDISGLRQAADHAAISGTLGTACADADDVVAIGVLDAGVVAYTFAG